MALTTTEIGSTVIVTGDPCAADGSAAFPFQVDAVDYAAALTALAVVAV